MDIDFTNVKQCVPFNPIIASLRAMKAISKAYLATHFSVVLWGFTAILGKLLIIEAVPLVWWRVIITASSLAILMIFWFEIEIKSIRNKRYFMLIGVLIGIHWVCFYGSIKASNASVALICMATTSLFTSIIEPIVLKRKLYWYEMIIGILIIPGMMLIVSGLDQEYIFGLILGLFAAFFAALFSTFNAKYIQNEPAVGVSFIEIGSAALFLTLGIPIFIMIDDTSIIPVGSSDWIYIFILALVCTTLPFVISLEALKHISAFSSNLIINLEPVYGILLAALILGEYDELNTSFYIGATSILIAVLAYPFIKKRFENSAS